MKNTDLALYTDQVVESSGGIRFFELEHQSDIINYTRWMSYTLFSYIIQLQFAYFIKDPKTSFVPKNIYRIARPEYFLKMNFIVS